MVGDRVRGRRPEALNPAQVASGYRPPHPVVFPRAASRERAPRSDRT